MQTTQSMYRFLNLLLFLMCCQLTLLAQEEVILSGTISEAESGETLIGATILVKELNIGTGTNEYGFYSLSVPKGKTINIEFSYVGFNTIYKELRLDADQILDIELSSGVQLDEVVVKANSFEEQLRSTEMSVEEITTKEAKLVPVIFGESDILKTIQLKPGIPSGSEGTTGLFVRGGGSDQNLIVLDEAVVYNANHLFGFFSTFNTDAVKDLRIYKGGFPAQYGGRLSSVIDVKLKEGNAKKFSGTGGLGIISSRLTLEGPIEKDKSSFIVSGRRTYVDIFTRLANQANEDDEDFTPIPDYFFYDLNTKINFKFGEKDRLYISGYFGRDVFGFQNDFFNFDFDWGNATGTVRWNHVFNPKLFSNTTFTYSDYQYNIQNRITGFSFKVGSNIRDANFKTDFYYAINNSNTLRFGASATYHQFTVGRLRAGSDDGEIQFSAGQDFDGIQAGAYIADEVSFSPKLKMNAGLRLSGFFNDGSNYFGIEPRAALNYTVNDRLAFKASYARMYQYLHLVANSGITLPTDIWYPSTERVKPQSSNQVAIGGSYLLNRTLFFNVEAYYKTLDNQIEFVDGAELFANDNLEQEFAIGKGRSYGLEFSVEKKEGDLTGWIGYTLSWTRRGDFTLVDDRQFFEQQRFGDFAPIYDRRHDISVVAIYEINRRLTATATFVYGSGDLRWLPTGRFLFQDVHGERLSPVVPIYEDRNNFRLPAYHRLDLGLVIKFFPKWGESDLTINVINVYDRRNTFFIYLEPETVVDANTNIELPTRIVANQVSLFPILPSLTWNFKF